MKKNNSIIRRIQKWYRNLFIEYPEDYGDPMSPAVEQFNEELKDEKDSQAAEFEHEHSKPEQQG